MASAQHLGALPGLPPALPSITNTADGLIHGLRSDWETDADIDKLAQSRADRLRDRVRAHPESLELDARGEPVVRGEVLAISPSPAALDAAVKAGFTIVKSETLDEFGVTIVALTGAQGGSAEAALRRLRRLDPAGRYDLDPIYESAGEASPGQVRPTPIPASTGRSAGAAVVGLIDTGVATSHPAIAGGLAEQRGFAPGGVRPAAHGTAVASLMMGRSDNFHGAAPGARLYAADVYGEGPTGGSAEALIRALAWMAQMHVPVINISLVGPPNVGVEAAVRAILARGALIVAPVGNDGPAAPPAYPAAYTGVIAVTAVDLRGRPLLEDGHAMHTDFAAPGADILAARPDGGYGPVRGTSFACPIVSGRLALLLSRTDPALARQAVAQLASIAQRRDGENLGHGVIGDSLGKTLSAVAR